MIRYLRETTIAMVSRLKEKLGQNEKVVAKGTGIAFLGIFAFNISSFALLIAKTRLMPASDVGLLVLAKSIVLTAFVLTNGFSYAVFRYAG